MRKFHLWTVLIGATVASFGLGLIAFDLWRSYTGDIHEAERATRNLTVVAEACDQGATFFMEFSGKGVSP